MMLFIDMGNTRTKLSLFTPHSSVPPTTYAVAHTSMADIAAWLRLAPQPITHAYGIQVAGKERASQLEALLKQANITPQWLDSTTAYAKLHNAYPEPHKLGVDRWFSAIGLVHQYAAQRKAIVHASFGTATTVDSILLEPDTDRYQFAGGLIFPGPALMHQSLATATANLGLGEGQQAIFPTDTRSAISTGVAAAQAGAVVRQWIATAAQCQHAPLLVCSGGGRAYVEHELVRLFNHYCLERSLAPVTIHWQSAPALQGLAAVARI